MKAVLAVFVFVLLVPIVGNSFAQSDNPQFFVFVQTQIRNSQGQLVAYLEANKVLIPEPDLFDDVLDKRHPSANLTRAGQNFELVKIGIEKQITRPDVISKTALATVVDGKEAIIIYSDHDGYPIVEGDTVTSVWTVIRPARGS